LAGTLATALFLRFLFASEAGRRDFDTWSTVLLYYITPAATATLCFLALWFKPLNRLRLLLLLLSVTVSLYVLEFALISGILPAGSSGQAVSPMNRLRESRNKASYAAQLMREFGVPIDSRSPSEALRDFQAQDSSAVPIVGPKNHLFEGQADGGMRSAVAVDGREVVPLGAISQRSTLLCNESGEWISYLSDRRGFNNPDEVWDNPRIEIAALGDSFPHGYCVPGDRNFVALIRRQHPATLNLGMAGDGPLFMLATLTEVAAPRTPRVVLWFYYEGNDLVDLQVERKNAVLLRYLDPGFSQPVLEHQHEIDQAILAQVPRLEAVVRREEEQLYRNRWVYGTLDAVKLSSLRLRLGLVQGTDSDQRRVAADFETDNMTVFRDIMRQAKAKVDGWQGAMYFVYLPEWARYARYGSSGKDKRDAVLGIVREAGIPIIDLDERFRESDPLSLFPFRSVGHYNEAGHQAVADVVLPEIR